MPIDARIPLMGRQPDFASIDMTAKRSQAMSNANDQYAQQNKLYQLRGGAEGQAQRMQQQEQRELAKWEQDQFVWDLSTAQFLAENNRAEDLQSFLQTRLAATQAIGSATAPIYASGIDALNKGGIEGFNQALASLQPEEQEESYTLTPGAARFSGGEKIAENPAKPDAPKERKTSTRTFVGDDGNEYSQLQDAQTGQLIGEKWLTKTAPQAGADVSPDQQQKAVKATEAIGLIDNMIASLESAQNTPGIGTGVIEGSVLNPFNRGWREQFEANRSQLFAFSKDLLRTKGEGTFTEQDARDYKEALADMGKDESVNIASLQTIRRLSAQAAGAGGAQPAQAGQPAQQFREGQTATNRQTGEQMVYTNGQWVLVR